MSYEELEQTEKMISLRDPLVSVPELVDMALDERVLRIVTHFFGFIPPWFKALVVRDFPGDRPRESSNFHRDNDEADSVQVFIYLVDIDDARGPLVYVPGSNHYDVRSCRPRLARDLGIAGYDGRVPDTEIVKCYPPETWESIRVRRGSIAIIHGNGFHKGPSWPRHEGAENRPRTAIRLDFNGFKIGKQNRWKANRIRQDEYERLSAVQRLFVDPSAVVR